MRCSNPACVPFGEAGLFLGGGKPNKKACFEGHNTKVLGGVQGGPLPVVIGVITPISRAITPGTPIYFRPFIEVITPVITSRGPPCMMYICIKRFSRICLSSFP